MKINEVKCEKHAAPPRKKKKQSKHTHWKYCLFFFLCPADHFLCCRFQKQSLNLIVLLAVIMTPSAPGSRAITSLFFYSQTQRKISFFFFLWSWKVSISLINLFAIYTQCSIYICTLRYPDSQSNPLSKGRMRKRVRRKILWGETTKLHVIHVAERILRFMEPEKTKLPGSSSG